MSQKGKVAQLVPKASVELEKTVLVSFSGKHYVGNPVWQEVFEDDGTGKQIPSGAVVVVEVKNVWQLDVLHLPIPQNDGRMAIMSPMVGTKIGHGIDIPGDALICELASDSPYYIEYVRLTSGIDIAKPSDIKPVGPIRH